MRIFNSHTLTSLLTVFLFVVAFTLTGCTADSLTGPILDSESTIQLNGDEEHNATSGDEEHNKDEERNKFSGDEERND